MTSSNNLYKKVAGLALAITVILVIPLVLTLLNPTAHMNGGEGGGFDWTPFDFVFMGALIFGTGLTYILVTRRADNIAYRAAVGVALAAGFLLVWVNGAVGIIGDPEDGSAMIPNLIYFWVLAIGFIGALFARFRPRGMAISLFAMGIAQMLVPAIVLLIAKPLIIMKPPDLVGVFGINAFFAALFVLSALLFRQATRDQTPVNAEAEG